MGNLKKFTSLQLCALIVLVLVEKESAAQPLNGQDGARPYDYTKTEYILYHGEEGAVLLAPPFEYPAPVVGALAYEIVLAYARRFDDIIVPPIEEPTHVFDLLMRDRHDRRRLGQRLFMGEAWLSDGKRIAFMEQKDYLRLKQLFDRRYEGTEKIDSALLGELTRPGEQNLPADWLPEEKSIEEAIKRMSPSGFEYAADYPDAQVQSTSGASAEENDHVDEPAQAPQREAHQQKTLPQMEPIETAQLMAEDALEANRTPEQVPVAEKSADAESAGAGEDIPSEPEGEGRSLNRFIFMLLLIAVIFPVVRLLGGKRRQ